MTIKEELEILRGEPIQVFDGDPMDIPCIETSDADRLCKHPVVSVNMITYNHEPYIRQAIEGVMMQQTDFEFELIIGEDCSQDRTREICFEYQKKYPDKIRVLWWHKNVSKLGGNGRRTRAHCRGEFIAFCEGDDYWIDPLKLQKQVDAMRENANVSFIFTSAKIFDNRTGEFREWDGEPYYKQGCINGEDFFKVYSYGKSPARGCGPECFIMTASCLIRNESFRTLSEKYDLFSWRLYLGDKQLWLGLSTLGDVYYLSDRTVVYRENSGGAMNRYPAKIYRDSSLVKIYFAISLHLEYCVPISILIALLHDTETKRCFGFGSYFKQCEAIKSIIGHRIFCQNNMTWKLRVRWMLFKIIKQKWVFKIGRGMLFK